MRMPTQTAYYSSIPTYIPPVILSDRPNNYPAYSPSTSQLTRTNSNRITYDDDPWNSARAEGLIVRHDRVAKNGGPSSSQRSRLSAHPQQQQQSQLSANAYRARPRQPHYVHPSALPTTIQLAQNLPSREAPSQIRVASQTPQANIRPTISIPTATHLPKTSIAEGIELPPTRPRRSNAVLATSKLRPISDMPIQPVSTSGPAAARQASASSSQPTDVWADIRLSLASAEVKPARHSMPICTRKIAPLGAESTPREPTAAKAPVPVTPHRRVSDLRNEDAVAARLFSKATPERSLTVLSATTVWSQPSRSNSIVTSYDFDAIPEISDEGSTPGSVNWDAVDSALSQRRQARDRHSFPSTKEESSWRLASESYGTITDEVDGSVCAEVMLSTASPIEGGSGEQGTAWRKWEEEDCSLTAEMASANALRRQREENEELEQLWNTVKGLLDGRPTHDTQTPISSGESSVRTYSLRSGST